MDIKLQKLQEELLWGDISHALEMMDQDRSLLNGRISGNFTPLMIAVTAKKPALVSRLIQMGAKIDIVTAAYLGDTEAVRAFLDRQPSLIRKHDPWGAFSLLHIAAQYGDTEMVQLLLLRGIDANERTNPSRQTPLFFAHKRPFANAELLLCHGANIQIRAKHGFTLLHRAVMMEDLGWLEFLLSHGADPEAQTNARQSPWMLAVRHKRRRAADILTEFGRTHIIK